MLSTLVKRLGDKHASLQRSTKEVRSLYVPPPPPGAIICPPFPPRGAFKPLSHHPFAARQHPPGDGRAEAGAGGREDGHSPDHEGTQQTRQSVGQRCPGELA